MMINASNMIIVGSTGRNVGKTQFCCALIRRQARTGSVVAIKISPAISLNRGAPFLITEENSITGDTDTARMLRAGAHHVFRLRVLRDHLAEALTELLERIPENTCIVCESTSARSFVEPGVFIVIQDEGSDEIKPSCRKVMRFADCIATFHGDDWDMDPDRLTPINGCWTISADDRNAAMEGSEP